MSKLKNSRSLFALGFFFCFYLPAIIVRTFLLKEQGLVDHPFDYMGGYLSGIIASSLFALFVSILVKFRLIGHCFSYALVVIYLMLVYGNYEHVKALGHSAHYYYLYYLFDPTFFKGSLLSLSNLPLFVLSFIFPIIIAPFVFSRLRKMQYKAMLSIVCFCFVALGIHISFDASSQTSAWRAYDMIHSNVLSMYLDISFNTVDEKLVTIRPFELNGVILEHAEREELNQLITADLSGKTTFSKVTDKPNVLIIIVEGLSAQLFPSLSGKKSDVYQFNAFDNSLRNFSRYRNFFIHSTQTNRGTYSLLCSDYPTMTTYEKAAIYQFASSAVSAPKCIPQDFTENGYHTVYLQSANLSFMSKDMFMDNAGFAESYGVNWFQSPYSLNDWGVDDRSFFEQSLKMIDQLEDSSKPWFLTLLTSGTHHPYNLPDDWATKHGHSLESAYKYLDKYFPLFIAKLKKKGVFDNTIVIVTSDEVRGNMVDEWLENELSRRWGPLFISLPNEASREFDQLYSMNDVGTGLLDYLGWIKSTSRHNGRSIFRTYDTPRIVPFGEPSKYVGLRHENGSVDICNSRIDDCRLFQSKESNRDRIVHDNWAKEVPSDLHQINLLRGFLAHNEMKIDDSSASRFVQLGKLGQFLLKEKNARVTPVGYQYLTIPTDHALIVSFRIEVKNGTLELFQWMNAESGRNNIFAFEPILLEKGQTYYSTFRFNTKQEYEDMEFGITVTSISDEVELDFQEAELEIFTTKTKTEDVVFHKQLVVDAS